MYLLEGLDGDEADAPLIKAASSFRDFILYDVLGRGRPGLAAEGKRDGEAAQEFVPPTHRAPQV